jgi:hypothetical protein
MRFLATSVLSIVLGFLGIVGCGGADSRNRDEASAGAGGSENAQQTQSVDSTAGKTGLTTKGSGGAKATNATSGTPGTGFCSGNGPIVTVTNAATSGTIETCTGRIAETRFMNALCTCNDATVAGYLKTSSFDSVKRGPTDTGGSVGINNTYSITTGYTDVGGAFAIAGADSLSFAGYLKVNSDLRLAGEALVAGYTKVGHDAWLAQGFTDLGPVTVQGDLHVGSTVMAIPLTVNGSKTQEAITISKPCPCESKDLLDVGALVDDAKTNNDNAAHGIDSKMLNLVVGNVEAILPCGRFYLEKIGGAGNIIVNVTGRVALFIEENLAATGNLEFRLADGAEIDIFVKKNVVLTGRAVFGTKERPAASRIYVGGDGDVLLVGADGFVGNVYAPRSRVTAVGYLKVWGSVFARDFVIPGYADFSYDRAIQHAGDNCDVPTLPPGTCSQCGTCTGGTACVDGQCGACRNDADCCSQQVCMDGVCSEPLVLQ